MKKQFEIGIDHELFRGAKAAFNTCMRAAVAKAIATGSYEGSATLKINFEIYKTLNQDTGEFEERPEMKYKAGYSVPMKESVETTINEKSQLHRTEEGYALITGQICMDELLAEEEPEEYRGERQLAEVR